MKKLSVIMPVYNSEQYVSKSIESVLSQTYKNIELLIINDGSTDSSPEIIKSYTEKDIRIKYFEIENSGSAVARNIGLENATGDFISFVDSDDYIDQVMFEELIKKSDEYSADIVSCSYEMIFTDKIVPEETYLPAGYYSKEKMVTRIYPSLFSSKSLKDIVPKSMWTKIYRKEIIDNYDIKFIPELKMSQDIIFSTKCLLYANSFYYLPEKKYYKYYNNNSSRTNTYLKDIWKILKSNYYQLEKLASNFPEYKSLKEQLPYALTRHSMTAIANISKNKINNKNKVYAEIEEIIQDEDLKSALNKVDTSDFNIIRKIVVIMLKIQNKKLLYLIILFYKKIDN